MLSALIVSHNRIRSTEGLQECLFLQTLDLSHNRIRQLTGLDGLPLQLLNLVGGLGSQPIGLQLADGRAEPTKETGNSAVWE